MDNMAGTHRLMKANRRTLLIKAGLAVALVAVIMLSWMALVRIQQFAESSKTVEQTHRVIEGLHQVLLDVKDAESVQRGYLITGADSFLLSHDATIQRLQGRMHSLRELIGEMASQQHDEWPVLEQMVAQRLQALQQGITLFKKPSLNNEQLVELVQGKGLASMAQLHAQVHRMLSIEENQLKQRAEKVENNANSTRQWIFFGNLFAVGFLGFAMWATFRESEQRRQAQRETQRYTAQLELTNKELESFSYSVSHDLRSPLRAIDGYSRILQEDYEDKLDDEGRRVLNVVRDSSKKMGMLIDDLLTFSRMGRKPVEARRIDMNELVMDVWREVVSHADREPLFHKDHLPECHGDRPLIRQVLVNLLSNAVKYSSTMDQPSIRVDAEEADGEAIYRIADNGVGFDMRFYDKLFGVFQRLHREDEFPGTGVGLAIVKRVIVRHGGRVSAQSEPGKETVFSFSLPTEAFA
ncbi:sensor histidine kinase [uncultured Oxalicibacterium sp.]|uniref:sensor histidine kinase n=1 Tax=uncultured Oxalicibacterium sp. TaxID=1168540 RepID=UPI0025F794C6|nr:sensor histidine kinase [uncultured Oxalicibacterium sp.]